MLASNLRNVILAIMADKPATSVPAATESTSKIRLEVPLTLVQTASGQPIAAIRVGVAEFITYSEQPGFTRLKLTRGKTLDVKETTGQIDHLVRNASSQQSENVFNQRMT